MESVQDQQESNIDLIHHIVPRLFSVTGGFDVGKLGSGMCNDSYLIKSPDTKIVVRLSKPHREYKAFREYEKEMWCMSKARALGIPTPEVLHVMQWSDRACMIQSYVDGVAPGADELLRVWEVLGQYAKKIHSVRVSGWGEHLKYEDGTFGETWEEHLAYNIESLNEDDPLIEKGILAPIVSKEVKAFFQSLKQKKFEFGLCHGDISIRNTLVDANKTVYLLDWGCAKAEVIPHYEINEILGRREPDASLGAFLRGYGISQIEFKKMEDDLAILALLRDIDTLRWAMDKEYDAIPNLIPRVQRSLERKFRI